jgi:hypothetical protein
VGSYSSKQAGRHWNGLCAKNARRHTWAA